MNTSPETEAAPEFKAAIRACTKHFWFAAFFTVFVNVLALTYPIYMIQVFDRVISSRSLETLIALFCGVMIALIFRAIFSWLRSRLLVRASVRIDRMLCDRVFGALLERSGTVRRDTGSQPLRDLDTVRQFTTGRGATAAMDAPWAGLFLAFLFAVDIYIGATALACMAIVLTLVVVNALTTRRSLAEGNKASTISYQFAEANLRSADAILAMGMLPGVVRRWNIWRNRALAAQVDGAGRSGAASAILGSTRIGCQALILAVGVTRVIYADMPFGIAFMGVILFGFAMRPVEAAVSSWEGYQQSKEALRRLSALLQDAPVRALSMSLPRPAGQLVCDNVIYVPPLTDRPVIKGVSFRVEAGTTLGILGPIGSGKTTLVRLIVGILRPTRGAVRLDGADVWGWSREDIGPYLGYLPQEISLLSGTVADNIGRFGQFDEAQIVEAAQRAGAHEIILALPKGYDTLIGEGGHPISGGQRQLIGLARAVVGRPSLVVLDEPNASLDGPGEASLMACIASLKAEGTTVIMVSHRPNLVRDLDQLAALSDGSIVSVGPSKAVLERMRRPKIVGAVAGNAES